MREELESQKKHCGSWEQHGLRIWKNMVEENKYGNMKGKIREEGKEFFKHKWMSFREDALLEKTISFSSVKVMVVPSW